MNIYRISFFSLVIFSVFIVIFETRSQTAPYTASPNSTSRKSQAADQLQIPSIFSNDMVLQAQSRIPVWGWGLPGRPIRISIQDQVSTTTIGPEGKWSLSLNPMPADGPLEMVISDGTASVVLKNIMIGEVWLSSGQSNMAMPLKDTQNGPAEAASANYPNIRLLRVPPRFTTSPQTFSGGVWTECTSATIRDFSAVAYYFGRHLHTSALPNTPIGLIDTSVDATFIEMWISREAFLAEPSLTQFADRSYYGTIPASSYYNGMIAPLLPYAIRGILWYQGEENGKNADDYLKLFPTLIRDWRSRWDQGNFPFLYVQLPNFSQLPETVHWPILREAQLLTLSEPNTAMVVTIDIGQADDIHPPNKQDVGYRLGLAAQTKAYGQNAPYSGPLYQAAAIEGDTIRIRFLFADGGLVDKNGGTLSGFQIGDEESTTTAEAWIDGNTVVVRNARIPSPTRTRYAWEASPPADLFNGIGLPASPFRTDYPSAPPLPKVSVNVALKWENYR